MTYAPDAITDIYAVIDPHFSSMERSGVLPKSNMSGGYHQSRARLLEIKPGDYSLRAPLDRLGDADASSGIDIKFNTSEIKIVTQRLIDACQDDDPRIYPLREVIGTIDGENVIAYNRYGDGQGGSRSTVGIKHGSAAGDPSHLWHDHISGFRKYANDHAAWRGIAGVIIGEEPETMPSLEQIADYLARDDEFKQAVAVAVWQKDGTVNNVGFAAGTEGRYVNGSTAQTALMERILGLNSKLDAILAKLP